MLDEWVVCLWVIILSNLFKNIIMWIGLIRVRPPQHYCYHPLPWSPTLQKDGTTTYPLSWIILINFIITSSHSRWCKNIGVFFPFLFLSWYMLKWRTFIDIVIKYTVKWQSHAHLDLYQVVSVGKRFWKPSKDRFTWGPKS